MKKTIFGILICVILLSSCGGDDVKEDSELSRNKYKWIEAQISHYKYELTLRCRCSFNDEMPLTIEVLNLQEISIIGGNLDHTRGRLNELANQSAGVLNHCA